MLPDDEVVEELTRDVFETVIGRTATPDVAQPSQARAYAVDVHGAWCGSVSIEVGHRLATMVANAMFDTPEAAPDDVRDAMCELANVIGGNLKGLLPGPSQLTIPRVEECEEECDEVPPGSKQLLFSCHGEPFSVTVRARQPETNQTNQTNEP